MKRSASHYVDMYDESPLPDSRSPQDGGTVEKRTRSGSPPLFVGPLVFSENGHGFHQAVYEMKSSDMPGVHRLTSPQPPPPVSVWSPHMKYPNHLETNLEELLQSINAACVFIFDPAPDGGLLNDLQAHRWLFFSTLIQRFGLYVSPHHPFIDLSVFPIPYIQDASGALERICKFHKYLGPTAVLTKNGQVVATCMLSRSPEAVLQIFDQWMSA